MQLQHFAASFLLTDAFLGCGVYSSPAQALCWVRNDNPMQALDAVATVTLARISGAGATLLTTTTPIALPRGAGAVQWFCFGTGDPTSGCQTLPDVLAAHGCNAAGSDCILFTRLAAPAAAGGATLLSSFELLGIPGSLALSDPGLSYDVAPALNADGSLNVTLAAANAPAAFVTLTSTQQGRFSENSFWLPSAGASATVAFIPFGPLDTVAFANTLRVEHLQQYL